MIVVRQLLCWFAVVGGLLLSASALSDLPSSENIDTRQIRLIDRALNHLPVTADLSARLALLEYGQYIAHLNDDLATEARFLSQAVQLYAQSGQLEIILNKLDEAAQHAADADDWQSQAKALYLGGHVHLVLGNYKSAYERLIQVEDLFSDSENYPLLRIDNLIAIAEVSLEVEMPDLAAKTLKRLEHITPSENRRQWAAIYHLKAVTARKQGKMEEARDYLQQSKELAKTLYMPELRSANLLLFLRLALEEQDDSALYRSASEALMLAQELDIPQLRRNTLEVLAEAELRQNDPQAGTEIMDEEMIDAELKLLDYLILSSRETGNLEKAVQALERKLIITEKLHELKTAREKQALQSMFSLQQKEAENRLLRKENQLQQLENAQVTDRLQKQLLALALVAILLSILIYAYFRKYRQHKNVEIIAYTDELTGAINRRAIMDFANQKLRECLISHTPMSVIIFDLDHFKKINDRFGHDVGDNVLKAFVAVCNRCLRHSDRIGRIGGEEWMLVLVDAQEEDTERVIQRIRKSFAKRKVTGIPPDYPLTFSAGIAPLDSPSDTVESLCKRADQALYEAKRKGRDRHEYASRLEPEFLCFDNL